MQLPGRLALILTKELRRGWASAVLTVLVVAIVTGAIVFLSVSGDGFQREITRSVRDLGSNIVILPKNVDQVAYHLNGGFSTETMRDSVVEELLANQASLNHLIPMLERQENVSTSEISVPARIVGLAASIPMPGRPKSPMQRAIEPGTIQLGSQLASRLNIGREDPTQVEFAGSSHVVQRVNKPTGTWQDTAVFMDLEQAQSLFHLPNRISRIEAVECTSEKCAVTGQTPLVVLRTELSEITDEAIVLRREAMAQGRRDVRGLARNTLQLVNNTLWITLVGAVCALAALNTFWRRSEIGLLTTIGYGPSSVIGLIVSRAGGLSLLGALLGAFVGIQTIHRHVLPLLVKTGTKLEVHLVDTWQIVFVAVGLSVLAACVPGLWAVSRQPADVLGGSG